MSRCQRKTRTNCVTYIQPDGHGGAEEMVDFTPLSCCEESCERILPIAAPNQRIPGRLYRCDRCRIVLCGPCCPRFFSHGLCSKCWGKTHQSTEATVIRNSKKKRWVLVYESADQAIGQGDAGKPDTKTRSRNPSMVVQGSVYELLPYDDCL